MTTERGLSQIAARGLQGRLEHLTSAQFGGVLRIETTRDPFPIEFPTDAVSSAPA